MTLLNTRKPLGFYLRGVPMFYRMAIEEEGPPLHSETWRTLFIGNRTFSSSSSITTNRTTA